MSSLATALKYDWKPRMIGWKLVVVAQHLIFLWVENLRLRYICIRMQQLVHALGDLLLRLGGLELGGGQADRQGGTARHKVTGFVHGTPRATPAPVDQSFVAGGGQIGGENRIGFGGGNLGGIDFFISTDFFFDFSILCSSSFASRRRRRICAEASAGVAASGAAGTLLSSSANHHVLLLPRLRCFCCCSLGLFHHRRRTMRQRGARTFAVATRRPRGTAETHQILVRRRRRWRRRRRSGRSRICGGGSFATRLLLRHGSWFSIHWLSCSVVFHLARSKHVRKFASLFPHASPSKKAIKPSTTIAPRMNPSASTACLPFVISQATRPDCSDLRSAPWSSSQNRNETSLRFDLFVLKASGVTPELLTNPEKTAATPASASAGSTDTHSQHSLFHTIIRIFRVF